MNFVFKDTFYNSNRFDNTNNEVFFFIDRFRKIVIAAIKLALTCSIPPAVNLIMDFEVSLNIE